MRLICQGCQDWSPETVDPLMPFDDAFDTARKAHWADHDTHGWHCPKCVQTLRAKQLESLERSAALIVRGLAMVTVVLSAGLVFAATWAAGWLPS